MSNMPKRPPPPVPEKNQGEECTTPCKHFTAEGEKCKICGLSAAEHLPHIKDDSKTKERNDNENITPSKRNKSDPILTDTESHDTLVRSTSGTPFNVNNQINTPNDKTSALVPSPREKISPRNSEKTEIAKPKHAGKSNTTQTLQIPNKSKLESRHSKKRKKEQEKQKEKKRKRPKSKEYFTDRKRCHPEAKEEIIGQAVVRWLGKDENMGRLVKEEKKKPLSHRFTRVMGMSSDLNRRGSDKSADRYNRYTNTSIKHTGSLPRVLAYPRKSSGKRDSLNSTFKEEILSYLRVSLFEYNCTLSPDSILHSDGIGLRFNMSDASLVPLVLPLKNDNFPPTQWNIPLTRNHIAEKPNLEIIVQDFSANIVIGHIIVPIVSIPIVHPSMTFGIIRSYVWNPFWNICGSIRIGFKLVKTNRIQSKTGTWSNLTCGGGLTNSTWINSPQYYFKLVQESSCAITLCSSVGESNVIGFYVFLLDNDLDPKQRLNNDNLNHIKRNIRSFNQALRVDMEIRLQPGHYIILPCTLRSDILGDYQITASTTDGTIIIDFTELELPAPDEKSDPSESSESTDDYGDEFGANLDVTLALNKAEDTRDIDEIDWDEDLDNFDLEDSATGTDSKPSSQPNRRDGNDSDGFGDGFDDDFELPNPHSSNKEQDDFEDGFDADFDIPLVSPEHGTENTDDPFDNLDDLDLNLEGQSSQPDDSKIIGSNNDDEKAEEDDFGADFDLPGLQFNLPTSENNDRTSNVDDMTRRLEGIDESNNLFTPRTPRSDAIFDLIANKSTESLKKLLQEDPSKLEARNTYGDTPLLFAIKSDKIEAVKILLSQENINVNETNAMTKLPPPLAALRASEKTDILELLIQYNCNLHLTDDNKISAYLFAISSGKKHLLETLSKLVSLPEDISPQKVSQREIWELSSLYMEETFDEESSIRPAEALEILEIICPYGETCCVFQLILYNLYIFSANIITVQTKESPPWHILLSGFLDCILNLIYKGEISSNFSIVTGISGVSAHLVTADELKWWDRGVNAEQKEYGLLCHIIESPGDTKNHIVLDYVNYIEHSVVDLRKHVNHTSQKLYRLCGVLSNWRNRALQDTHAIGPARFAFSLSEIRNVKKDLIKSDLYFIVGIDTHQAKSLPKRCKENRIQLSEIWSITTDCKELYIVLYSRDKNVNGKPVSQIRIPMKEIKEKKRSKTWIQLDVLEIHFEYCYAPSFAPFVHG